MRSVPPAEFAREAAALSPSESFSNFRTERMVQAVNRQIAVRGNRKRLILPASRLWAVAMRLSFRQGSTRCRIRMLHHRLASRQGFFWRWRERRGDLTQKTALRSRNEKIKIGSSLY